MGDKLDREKSKVYRAGGYFSMPADHSHFVWTKDETLIQVHGVGPTSITVSIRPTIRARSEARARRRWLKSDPATRHGVE